MRLLVWLRNTYIFYFINPEQTLSTYAIITIKELWCYGKNEGIMPLKRSQVKKITWAITV